MPQFYVFYYLFAFLFVLFQRVSTELFLFFAIFVFLATGAVSCLFAPTSTVIRNPRKVGKFNSLEILLIFHIGVINT